MANKGIKTLAKFTALRLAAVQLNHQCSAHDTFYELDGVTDELKDEINKEISKIVNSLEVRAKKLSNSTPIGLIDLVDISQSVSGRM
ncbi:hypothetical protein ABVY18_004150 [Vibrio parahaemolyticus]|nr:hypothetical protein [Vibrio parahaemolyticus]EGR3062781.1 hypothetical protein [Vibrio parahaemolyticus]EGR3072928.1 hypothetical protein [Vibrio parahaemolyticus]EGR3174420.1 hypothetical protein [Vibrio parahaemolyticus]EJC6906645.1 hypothetical protein [Vibrio parahaemolyticus]